MVDESLLQVTGRFRNLFPVPGIDSYGAWSTFTWDNDGVEQHGAELAPTHAPWHDLFEALDEAGRPLSSTPVTATDEADAIVACCWRYGSYAHVLTCGELYPEFRRSDRLSRISDREMKRINLEFSSGLAAWLAERAEDPERVGRRVRAALQSLPMPWRRRRPPWWDAGVDDAAREAIAFTRQAIDENRKGYEDMVSFLPTNPTLRHEANWLVNWAYRNNNSIEDFHAGTWNHGSEVPGFLRLYAPDLERICQPVAQRMAVYLAILNQGAPEDRRYQYARWWPWPHDWSLTEETASVEFLGMPGAASLEPRLRWLATRCPTGFGSVQPPRWAVQMPVPD